MAIISYFIVTVLLTVSVNSLRKDVKQNDVVSTNAYDKETVDANHSDMHKRYYEIRKEDKATRLERLVLNICTIVFQN